MFEERRKRKQERGKEIRTVWPVGPMLKWKIMRMFTLNLKMVFQRGKQNGEPVQQQRVLPHLLVLLRCQQFQPILDLR